jgi:purine-binding chemotaxis protein CheW
VSDDPTSRAATLRLAFDRSFAEPVAVRDTDTVDLVAVRVASDPWALRLDQVAGLLAQRKVIALPSPLPELLGLVGHRGAVVPVFSLRALLGYRDAGEPEEWIALVDDDGSLVGLAFERFEGHHRIPSSGLFAPRADASARPHVAESARVGVDGALHPVLSVPSLLRAIAGRAGASKTSPSNDPHDPLLER